MYGKLRNKFNSKLDKLIYLKVQMFHRFLSAFQVCGYIGLVLSILLSMILVVCVDLSPWIMAGIILTSVLTFLGLAMITKIITREEKIIYYQINLELSHLETNEIVWIGEKKIKKYVSN